MRGQHTKPIDDMSNMNTYIPDDELREMLVDVRHGNEQYQEEIIDFLFWGDEFELTYSELQPDDEQWLSEWATKKNDVKALTLLLVGMEKRYRTWDEEFIDEETGEPFTFPITESVEGETLFPRNDVKALLMLTRICKDWQKADREELLHACNTIRCCTSQNYAMILRHMADEGDDREAMSELAEAYRHGDERNGIYVNRRLAKQYYDEIGKSYDPAEDDAEDSPVETTYTLRGNENTLEGIQKMINDLCEKFGTPDNELGLYVPMQPLMKLLVGSDDYRGNVIRMEQKDSNTLDIITQSNNPYPLFCALQQCFPDLNIEEKQL